MNRPPVQIPEYAPFTAVQRMWLNGYLAGLLSSRPFSESSVTPVLAAPPKERIVILYASQSGNSETLAGGFGESLNASGFDARVIGAEDFGQIDLTREKNLLVVSSTWGDGDPPDNAVDFWEALSSDDHPRLENLRFAVLGLGDSNYLQFCGMGKKFDQRLADLGAERLADRGDCDTEFEETAAAWFESVKGALGEAEARSPDPRMAAISTATPASEWSKKRPFPATMLVNRPLNAADSARDTRHFALSLAGSGLSYEAGDVLGVIPRNDAGLVDEIISVLPFSPDEPVPLGEGVEMPLRAALIEHFDIRSVNRGLVEAWAERSDSESLRALIQSDPVESSIEPWLMGREVIDLLVEHPARFDGAAEFTGLLRKLSPRLYSIASSLKAHADEVHLTVARVEYEAHGRKRKGVCSCFLSDCAEGDTVGVYLQTAKHFKLPETPETPVIMVGPGTGIAPFRAFLHERRAAGAPGKNWLFFGNPHEATDFFYRDELTEMKSLGHLSRLDTAWSRDRAEKIYVQDKMREAGAELWSWLQAGAHFYVCGDAKRMAKDVDDALHAVISEHGNLSPEAAVEYVSAMKKNKRYQRDVY